MLQSTQSSLTAEESIWSNGDGPTCVHVLERSGSPGCHLHVHNSAWLPAILEAFQGGESSACMLCRLWRVVNNAELAHSPLLLSFLELSEAVRVIPQQQPSPSRKSISEARPALVRFPSPCCHCCTRPHRARLRHCAIPHRW